MHCKYFQCWVDVWFLKILVENSSFWKIKNWKTTKAKCLKSYFPRVWKREGISLFFKMGICIYLFLKTSFFLQNEKLKWSRIKIRQLKNMVLFLLKKPWQLWITSFSSHLIKISPMAKCVKLGFFTLKHKRKCINSTQKKPQNEPLLLSFKRLWRFIHKEITIASMSCDDKAVLVCCCFSVWAAAAAFCCQNKLHTGVLNELPTALFLIRRFWAFGLLSVLLCFVLFCLWWRRRMGSSKELRRCKRTILEGSMKWHPLPALYTLPTN